MKCSEAKYRERKYISDCLGLGVMGEQWDIAKGYGVSIWGLTCSKTLW